MAKSPYEIAMLAHANQVSSNAHEAVMLAAKDATNERELHALFVQQCIRQGCPKQAYSSIVAGGRNAATLHYVKNDEDLAGRLNVLIDAGAESGCYAADITRVIPLSGTFSPESRAIYEIVLRMQTAALGMIRTGVLWDEIHVEAHRVLIRGLLELGILRGLKRELLEARVSVAFFPHGLGHFLGMDTHDKGGQPDYQDPDPMFRYLRLRRTLPAGSVVTVEPGCYFCRFIIDPYLQNPDLAKFIDKDTLDKYWEVGGIRIEDDVVVTNTGYTNLTTAPKQVEEVERLVRGD